MMNKFKFLSSRYKEIFIDMLEVLFDWFIIYNILNGLLIVYNFITILLK